MSDRDEIEKIKIRLRNEQAAREQTARLTEIAQMELAAENTQASRARETAQKAEYNSKFTPLKNLVRQIYDENFLEQINSAYSILLQYDKALLDVGLLPSIPALPGQIKFIIAGDINNDGIPFFKYSELKLYKDVILDKEGREENTTYVYRETKSEIWSPEETHAKFAQKYGELKKFDREALADPLKARIKKFLGLGILGFAFMNTYNNLPNATPQQLVANDTKQIEQLNPSLG